MTSIETDPNYTVVEYLDEHAGYRCGYCKSPDSNFSHGMWVHRMKVGHYQALIDRGWRRSGKYCYKPIMDRICCPQYTIKCDSSQFKLSKSQKKVLKRMHHFLSHGSIKAQEKVSGKDVSGSTMKENASSSLLEHIPRNVKLKLDDNISSIEIPLVKIAKAKGMGDEISSPVKLSKEGASNCDNMTEAGHAKKPKLADISDNKQKPKGNEPKSLEDFLNEPLPQNAAHKLEVKLVKVSPDEAALMDSIHMSYSIYRSYQLQIHNDREEDCEEESFHNFLVLSPLLNWKSRLGPKHGYGSFHHQYWLDGELIAVGVLDILPQCVSSVYLYYDPKYSFLSLGTYASLREIALTRILNQKYAELRWYYMGFYIHSCPKMRYKGNYQPSFLLCPETYIWKPIEECITKLDANKFCRFAPYIDSPAMQIIEEQTTLDKVLCLYRRSPVLFKDYRKKHNCTKEELEQVKLYLKLVGRVCAYSILLYRGE